MSRISAMAQIGFL